MDIRRLLFFVFLFFLIRNETEVLYNFYLKYIHEIDDGGLDNILLTLNAMEDGPEFAFTYEELNKIADDLIEGRDVNLG